MLRTPRTIVASLALASAMLVASPEALAQSSTKKGPVELKTPVPTREDTDRPTFMTFLVLVVVLAAIVGVNCIPSKRGHQD